MIEMALQRRSAETHTVYQVINFRKETAADTEIPRLLLRLHQGRR